jgi:hypothetical protein
MYESKKIFLLFDFVHIFKNIRNNWLNLKSANLSFQFPNIDGDEILTASFKSIRDFYTEECGSLVKKAYKLNHKTLYPSNIERQNVLLVDNVFHASTIAALHSCDEYKETAVFLQVIREWWDIMNVKSIINIDDFSPFYLKIYFTMY